MFSKTRSGEISREKIRMVRAVLPDTPKPLQFQPKLQFVHFLPYVIFQFSTLFLGGGVGWGGVGWALEARPQ